MTQRCTACKGRFVSHREPFCPRCAERRAEEKAKRWLRRWQDDCRATAEWARRLLAEQPLILDTETTGLDGYVVQLAVIDSQGAVLLDTLVQPQVAIEAGAIAVHGITPGMVAAAPTYAALHVRLSSLLGGRVVAVYNMPFDRDVLQRELTRLGVAATDEPYAAHWADIMLPYSTLVGEPGRHGSYRWQRLPGGNHSAVGDCQATLGVLRELAAYGRDG